MKTIQLSGGPFDGKRMVVPTYSAEVKFADAKTDGQSCYLPASRCTQDGLEIWQLAWSTGFGDSGAVEIKRPRRRARAAA